MDYKNPIPVLGNDVANRIDSPKQHKEIGDYPMHDNVYFAFIDVLGFKQAFDENREDPTKRFAKDYEDVFKYYSRLLRNARFIHSGFSKAGQTSDSLYFYTDRTDYLAEFIKIYLHFSLYSMSKNVFFRGGIAKGCLFINEPHQFYGDCVIKAYLLEEKIAKYPRIALDQETYNALKDIPELVGALKPDSPNGRFYLNPFVHVTKSELSALTNLEVSDIQSIKKKDVAKHIAKGKKRFEFDEKNYPKYQFLSERLDESDKVFEEI